MGAASSSPAANLRGVRVAVVGDPGTGKSSLVVSVAKGHFPDEIGSVVPPTRLAADRVPITVVDTSSRPEDRKETMAECITADAVVLTYSYDCPATLQRACKFWLPELRRIKLKAPVILVGCKMDLIVRDDEQRQLSHERLTAPIMHAFPQIVTCTQCSALHQIQVYEVFDYAQKAVIHPIDPLYDQETRSIKPRCMAALKRIFLLCDEDKDEALSDEELNKFQVRCYNTALQPAEILSLKRVVQQHMPLGVNDNGLTFIGFLYIHALFIEKRMLEDTWTARQPEPIKRKLPTHPGAPLSDIPHHREVATPECATTRRAQISQNPSAAEAGERERERGGGGAMAAAAAATAANLAGKQGVRVVVIGDPGTGKSSLVVSVATEQFPENVPRVMPPTRLPADYFPDRVPITIVDTSSSPEQRAKLIAECQAADAVVLTYACDRPGTLERLSSFWLPELRRLQLKAPVIVVGCKLDLRDEQQVSLEQVMAPIMQTFREIETCIECSALRQIQVPEVFYYAQKAVLHPTAPLFDQEAQSLKPRCVRALKRIFILCDHDRDGALSDVELNDFQVKCFNAPLQPTEIAGVKRVVQEKMPEGVSDNGLTLTGFLFLHALFIEKGRLETTWTVLRKFGYDNEIKLRDDLIPTIKRAPDQTLELTNQAIDFLRGIFNMFDTDNDDALLPAELDDLFSTAPEHPWAANPYIDCAERNVLGGLSLEGFLSKWALMTLLDPANSFANLIYVGYSGDFGSAFTTTRKRRVDRKKQQTQRNVFQCYVFGPRGAGKTGLLQSFLGRQSADAHGERFAANTVDLSGSRKTLILREIPEEDVRSLLTDRESLAPCDVAVFVYDSCDEFSWQRARDLLVEVATHGENTGYEVPCLIVAAKDDLDQSPLALQESTRVSQDMGIETPIPISVRLRDLNNIFCRIVEAAQQPHLSIPETEAGKTRRQYRQLLNRSLMVVSVGAAVAVVGIAAYRVYAARKNTSS
uniref:Mitochondrial Rho GTPase n=1 Tax=Leersia perrieri TaxID=77586 RepID=A0A0D9W0J8_9ORYZ